MRNTPNTYPSGSQLTSVVLASAAERVRSGTIGLALLARAFPDARS